MLTEPACRGRKCLVVGSSPRVREDLIGHSGVDRAVIIGVNGGGRIALDMIGRLDVLVTTSHLFQGRLPHERETVDSIKGIYAGALWVDEKSGRFDAGMSGLTYGRITRIDRISRDWVVFRSSGFGSPVDRRADGDSIAPLNWVSSGVWAICLAKLSGASDIKVAGISSQNGHYGIGGSHTRGHLDQDTRVMAKMGYELQ